MELTPDSGEMLQRTYERYLEDGKLDVHELDKILAIALRDGVLDDSERTVLKNIIFNLNSTDLTPEMWQRVEAMVKAFGLDRPD